MTRAPAGSSTAAMDSVSTFALIAGLGRASGMLLYAVLFFPGVIHPAPNIWSD